MTSGLHNRRFLDNKENNKFFNAYAAIVLKRIETFFSLSFAASLKDTTNMIYILFDKASFDDITKQVQLQNIIMFKICLLLPTLTADMLFFLQCTRNCHIAM